GLHSHRRRAGGDGQDRRAGGGRRVDLAGSAGDLRPGLCRRDSGPAQRDLARFRSRPCADVHPAGGVTMRKDIRAVAAGAAILAFTFPAGAACPIELATYGDTSGVAEIDFSPVILPEEGEPEISNSFRLL